MFKKITAPAPCNEIPQAERSDMECFMHCSAKRQKEDLVKELFQPNNEIEI